MGSDNTLIYIIVTVVAAHFIIGIAYLIYKIYGGNRGK